MKIIYIILYIILLSSAVYSYQGRTNTSISINITNTSIIIYNDEFMDIININWTNQTSVNKSYYWNTSFEYNLSGYNITILNYTYIYNYTRPAEEFEEIKEKLDNLKVNCSNNEEEAYYHLYFGCFTNYTICNEYRKNNEQYKSNYDNCISIKEDCNLLNRKLEGDYYLLNQTVYSCIVNKDNYKSQRWVFLIVGGAVLLGLYHFVRVVYPNMKRSGKFLTGRSLSPSAETINPDRVRPSQKKQVQIERPKPKNRQEMINPNDVSFGGK